jgi:hypothetical protein
MAQCCSLVSCHVPDYFLVRNLYLYHLNPGWILLRAIQLHCSCFHSLLCSSVGTYSFESACPRSSEFCDIVPLLPAQPSSSISLQHHQHVTVCCAHLWAHIHLSLCTPDQVNFVVLSYYHLHNIFICIASAPSAHHSLLCSSVSMYSFESVRPRSSEFCDVVLPLPAQCISFASPWHSTSYQHVSSTFTAHCTHLWVCILSGLCTPG